MSTIEETTTGVMKIMSSEGDTRVTWSTTQPGEVEAARATFESLRSKGYVAYAGGSDGREGRILNAFDATAGEIVMRPAIQGG